MTSAAVPRATKEQVTVNVLERLKDAWPDILEDAQLESQLKRHLMRLPRRYALDIHNLEDLRTHMRLLDAVMSSPGAVVCDTRGVRTSTALGEISNTSLNDMDTGMASSSTGRRGSARQPSEAASTCTRWRSRARGAREAGEAVVRQCTRSPCPASTGRECSAACRARSSISD